MDVPINSHLHASGIIHVNKIAFGSCIKPRTFESCTFWGDVREFNPYLWLGDNMYGNETGGGINLSSKREEYNLVRDESSYSSHGLIKPDAKSLLWQPEMIMILAMMIAEMIMYVLKSLRMSLSYISISLIQILDIKIILMVSKKESIMLKYSLNQVFTIMLYTS